MLPAHLAPLPAPPPLPLETDVVVIGGGVVGTSIAYQLARRGKAVLVLEQRGLASGASGRNGGLVAGGAAPHAGRGDTFSDLTGENLRLLQAFMAETGAEFELRLPGTLDIATRDDHAAHLRAVVREQQALGLPVRWLDSAEVRDLVPLASPRILGAKFAEGHGHLWPFKLVHAFAAAAAARGARFAVPARVAQIVRRGGRACGVRVQGGGEVRAEWVVVATNAWSPLLLDELPPGAVVPARGQILVTEPLPHGLLPHPFGTNFDKEYGRQTPDGKVLVGGCRRFDQDAGLGHYAEETTPAVLAAIAGCLTALFPALRSARIVRAWAGIMGFTPDGLPLIGPVGLTDRLVVAAGFNGGGMSYAAIAGKLVAELIAEGTPSLPLDLFAPDRFSASGTAWRNPFTAGERHTRGSRTSAAH